MAAILQEGLRLHFRRRLDAAEAGDAIDGPEDPILSAPSTAKGKRRKRPFGEDTQRIVIDAYRRAGDGYPADCLLCDKEMNEDFVEQCLSEGIGGSASIWNRYLLRLRKEGKLPRATKRPDRITSEQMDHYGFASEVAWRLLSIDYRRTLDDILSSPGFAAEFDRLATEFGPAESNVTSFEYRRAALSIRKRSHDARKTAVEKFAKWMNKNSRLPRIPIGSSLEILEQPGVFVLCSGDVGFFAGESDNMRARVEHALDNDNWNRLEPDSVAYVENSDNLAVKYGLKAALAKRESPLLNCRLLVHDSELA